eukprot:1128655-Amphidinium_carterae.1
MTGSLGARDNCEVVRYGKLISCKWMPSFCLLSPQEKLLCDVHPRAFGFDPCVAVESCRNVDNHIRGQESQP